MATWLLEVLNKLTYQHKDRMYKDVEDVLGLFENFLIPKAESYAHDNGRIQYLLSLVGTIPIVYQSATYNIPVAYWLPLSYPSNAPIVFVTPTSDMHIKSGKYVDVSGRCYHPSLAYWQSDVSTTWAALLMVAYAAFARISSDIFDLFEMTG
ncbi:hypothetical protein BGX31_004451 [Mortierella sp. GBA43]|nr:hypothetical protein BGX31_004451 [Mortierella sp. GBA43]